MSGSQQIILGGSPQAAAVDPYFYSVTSLLHGDGTNGAQNNTFLDSSTNNFTITRNGNTTQGSFSPFSQTGWGNYFDGSGDYLTVASNAALGMGTGNFTVELWFYYTGTPSNEFLFDFRYDGGSLLAAAAGTFGVDVYVGAGNRTGGTVVANTWYHLAVTRSGSTCYVFLNGTQVGATFSDSTSLATGGVSIASRFNATQVFPGYISNFRVVKGTAVYTADFTVPTTPLTAIANTSLLTCQANRFLDASSNAFAITRNGDVSVQPFSPFNPTTAYSTSAVGGSGYFDGSGDYLSLADNAAFAMGTGNFTAEFWLYTADQSNNYPGILSASTYTDTGAISIRYDNTGNANKIFIYLAGASPSDPAVTSSAYAFGQWIHVAVIRDSSTALKIYVNGVLDGTATISAGQNVDFSGANSFYIGRGFDVDGGAAYYAGYITNVRLVKGQALASGNFTPPTAPVTASSVGWTGANAAGSITGTMSLLMSATNAGIFDNAAVADYETVGNAQISTSVKKYGTGSMSFDGTGDYLPTASNQNFAFRTGDFTVEYWIYTNSSADDGIFQLSTTAGGFATSYTNGMMMAVVSGVLYYALGGSSISTGFTINNSTWYHIAMCRTNGVVKVFVNGTQVASAANTTDVTATNLVIGGYYSTSYTLVGYIDDFRISNGVARYPYNFTPPTAEFPNIGGTVTLTADPYYEYTTLLLPGNGTNGAQNNTFLDSSTNNFTITRNGNTTQGTFSPFSQTGWGNYFDGTGDYLTVASNAAFGYGTGDFTIECWFYLNALPGGVNGSYIIDQRTTDTQVAIAAYIYSDASIVLYVNGGVAASGGTVVANQWNHFAICRSATTTKMFLNGTQIGSNYSDSNNYGTLPVAIASRYNGQDYVNGYISNFRLVKGTAVYTANFTPSTTPLTAITNTSLLTCQSNRFVDNSSNAFAITRNGDVSVQPFSPFNPTAAWSAATYGGSGYFDGSGDYLVTPSNANLSSTLLGSDFTIECWLYLTSYPSGGAPIWTNSVSNSDGFSSAYVTSTGTIGTGKVGTNEFATTATVVLNAWNHFATVRNGATVYTYLNGAQAASGAASTYLNTSATKPIQIAQSNQSSPANLTGYISGYRISTAAQYTGSTYTIPTAPPTAISGTNLLLNFTNAGILDATSKNDLETVGNAQISTAQSKFGGSSMLFDGSGDRLVSPFFPWLQMGSGDWTIEGWVYFASAPAGVTYYLLYANRASVANFSPIAIFINSSRQIESYFSTSGSSWTSSFTTSGTISTSTWTHVAVVKYGTTVRVYLNGIADANTATISGSLFANTSPLFIGGEAGGNDLNGYLDDYRVTKGIARYTSNFTPPTTAFLTL